MKSNIIAIMALTTYHSLAQDSAKFLNDQSYNEYNAIAAQYDELVALYNENLARE